MGGEELLNHEGASSPKGRAKDWKPRQGSAVTTGVQTVYSIEYDPDYFLFLGEARGPIASLWPAPVPLERWCYQGQAFDVQIL